MASGLEAAAVEVDPLGEAERSRTNLTKSRSSDSSLLSSQWSSTGNTAIIKFNGSIAAHNMCSTFNRALLTFAFG